MPGSAKQPPYAKIFVVTLIIMGLALPVIVWGSISTMKSMFNAPITWVPESFAERKEYDQFREHFEGNDVVVISWEGCTIGDLRLERLHDELANPIAPAEAELADRWFDDVLTGGSVVRKISSGPAELDPEEVISRLQGSLIGPRGTSCAVVVLSERGEIERKEALDLILDIAVRETHIPRDELRLAGPPVDGVYIDQESIRSLDYYSIPSAIVALLLCYLCLRNWRLTFFVLMVAAFGEGLVLAMVFYSGLKMNAVLVAMPGLVFVLTVASGVHLVNYYYDEIHERGLDGAPTRALLKGWVPTLLATTTTSIGLGSLQVSDMVPVRLFGIFSPIGVLVSVGLLFLLLPGVMQLWPVHIRSIRKNQAESDDVDDPLHHSDRLWNRFSAKVCGHAVPVSIVCLLLMIGAGFGLTWLHTSVNIRSLFVPDSPVLADYAWMEEHLGPMVPIEVVLHFDEDCPLDFVERMKLVAEVQREMEEVKGLDGTMSAATFAPELSPLGTRKSFGDIARERLIERKHDEIVDQLREARYLHTENGRQSWRISGRVAALGDINYQNFLDDLEHQVEPIIDQVRGSGDDRVVGIDGPTYTGVMSLVYEAQGELLNDLIMSFFTAFLLVACVMMFVLQNPLAGMAVMVPNVFPAMFIFGVMGWLGMPIDIGSMMTASVALGIAVVDSLHLLWCFRRECSRGSSRYEAARACYRHCGTAMVQTSLICGFGMLVFSLSDFVPTARFAWMMLAMLMTALAGDLLFLPSLLVGPAGRVFMVRNKKKETQQEQPAPKTSPVPTAAPR